MNDMIEQIQNAIVAGRILRLRMNGTPEESYITIEPHLILHNVLFDTNRLLMYILDHWSEGGHTGWTDIPLDSIIEVEDTTQIFERRNPKPVDWQVHDQLFPPVD
jgi:hypothetical protein